MHIVGFFAALQHASKQINFPSSHVSTGVDVAVIVDNVSVDEVVVPPEPPTDPPVEIVVETVVSAVPPKEIEMVDPPDPPSEDVEEVESDPPSSPPDPEAVDSITTFPQPNIPTIIIKNTFFIFVNLSFKEVNSFFTICFSNNHTFSKKLIHMNIKI